MQEVQRQACARRGSVAPSIPASPFNTAMDEAESPLPPASRASSPSTSIYHSPTQPQKVKTVTVLTLAQEEDMALWLQENELLYNKRKSYRL